MKLNVNKLVRIKQEILNARPDMKHYQGKVGRIDTTGDYASHCSVVWQNPGWRSFHNTSDLENVV